MSETTGEDAYAKAGVSQSDADLAVSRLVAALATADIGRPSRQVDLKGHYAAVIRLDERTGIALSTDGVGTKLLVAEEMGRFDTVGIDCIAMNVNDIICVGARPLAMLDYLAVEKADPEMCEQIGVGLARGAELAEIEIPGGELAQIGDLVDDLYEVGQIVTGRITKLVNFGAFARLDDSGVEGLIHISELSNQRVNHPKEVVAEGEEHQLRIIRIDTDKQRMGLSLKQALPVEEAMELDWEIAPSDEEVAEPAAV